MEGSGILESDGCGVRDPGVGLSGQGDYRTCLKESFDGYDTDKDGFITFEEVAAAWRRCLVQSNQEVDEERVRKEALKFMNELDKNKDDQVSFDEYASYFENLGVK